MTQADRGPETRPAARQRRTVSRRAAGWDGLASLAG
jgi:hypothetical protein